MSSRIYITNVKREISPSDFKEVEIRMVQHFKFYPKKRQPLKIKQRTGA